MGGVHSSVAYVRASLDPAANAVTVGGIAWTRAQGTSLVGKVEVSFASGLTGRARLEVRLSPERPENLFCIYLAEGGWLRRLCVNGGHQRRRFTHKHCAERSGPDDSYEPDDIPLVPRVPAPDPSLYREVFEAFAAECNVSLGADFTWTPPWKEER